MKKFLLTILALGSIAAANAQDHSILLYGNAGFASVKNADKSSFIAWNANPGIGYQFNSHWTVGLNLGFSQYATKATDTAKAYTTNYYQVGPFIRCTHAIANSEIFYYYGQLNATYEGGYMTHASDPSSAKHTGFDIFAYPAIGMHVGHNWGINLSIGGLGYSSDKYDNTANANSNFNFNFGKQLNIGASINFACHGGHGHHHMHGKKDADDDDAPKKGNKSKKAKESKDDDE